MKQNRQDLKEAKKLGIDPARRQSTLLGRSPGTDRGIGHSKAQRSGADEDGWESASDEDSDFSSVDSNLAYGRYSPPLGWSTDQPGYSRARRNTVVDPALFGPANSLHGIVSQPVGFQEVHVDLSVAPPTVADLDAARRPTSNAADRRESRRTGSVRAERRSPPLQMVYAVPTSDPTQFDAGRASEISDSGRYSAGRPDPVPLQQPQPLAPVSSKVLATQSETNVKGKESTSGKQSTAAAALAGVAVTAIGAAIAAERRDDRKGKARADEQVERKQKRQDYDRDDDRKQDSKSTMSAVWIDEDRARRDEERARRKADKKKYPNETREQRRERRRLEDEIKELEDRGSRRRQQGSGQLEAEQRRIAEEDDLVQAQIEYNAENRNAGPSTHVDPFQYQVADDAFGTPTIEKASMDVDVPPMNIVTIEREPSYVRQRSSSVKDARHDYYREQARDEKFNEETLTRGEAIRMHEDIDQSTAPIEIGAITAAVVAMTADEKRHSRRSSRDRTERRKAYGSSTEQERDYVQEEADRVYREMKLAQAMASTDDMEEVGPPRIVTPPGYEEKRKIGPFDAPNADFELDKIMTPSEYQGFTPIIARAYPSDRDLATLRKDTKEYPSQRPLLTLVQPTPVPTPLPEKQRRRSTSKVSETTGDDEPTDVTVTIGPKGEILVESAPISTTTPTMSRNVTWGKNEHRTYSVESPGETREEFITSSDKATEQRTVDHSATAVEPNPDSKGTAPSSPARKSQEEARSHPDLNRVSSGPDKPERNSESDTRHGGGDRKSSSTSSKKSAGWGMIAGAIAGIGATEIAKSKKPDTKSSSSDRDRHNKSENIKFSSASNKDRDTKSDVGTTRQMNRDTRGPSRDSEVRGRSRSDSPPAVGPKPVLENSAYMPGAFDQDDVVEELPRTESAAYTSALPTHIYQAPYAETVSDLTTILGLDSPGHEGAPPVQGFIVGEIPDTPHEEPAEHEFPVTPSRKEQKKREKAAKRVSVSAEPFSEATPSSRSFVEEPESYFVEPTSSRRDKKKSKKSKRDSSAWEDEVAEVAQPASTSGAVADDARPVEAFVAGTPYDEWESSRKKKKKSHRESGRYDTTDAIDVPLPGSSEVSRYTETTEDGDDVSYKQKRGSKHEDSRAGTPEDEPADYIVSSPSAPGAEEDEYEASRRNKSKTKSRERSQSVASRSSTKNDGDSDGGKSTRSSKSRTKEKDKDDKKDKKSGGFFGLFSSSASKSEPEKFKEKTSRSKDDLDLGKKEKRDKKSKRRSVAEASEIYGDAGSQSISDLSLLQRTKSSGTDPDPDEDREHRRKRSSSKSSANGHRSRRDDSDNDVKESFLAKAGTRGAGVGLAGAAVALAVQHQQRKADVAADGQQQTHINEMSIPDLLHSREVEANLEASRPAFGQNDVDPDIVERTFRPSIDPQYGDLLPLPPSNPGSPKEDPDSQLPSLPESRPTSPQEEELRKRERPVVSSRRPDLQTPIKSPSQSAIPLKFVMARGTPTSPSLTRSSPVMSPSSESVESPRARSRPSSWDAGRVKGFQPLFLVDKARRDSNSHSDQESPREVHHAKRHSDAGTSDLPTLAKGSTAEQMGALAARLASAGSESSTVRETFERKTAKVEDLSDTPIDKALEPNPVEPDTKDRSSYLFQPTPPKIGFRDVLQELISSASLTDENKAFVEPAYIGIQRSNSFDALEQGVMSKEPREPPQSDADREIQHTKSNVRSSSWDRDAFGASSDTDVVKTAEQNGSSSLGGSSTPAEAHFEETRGHASRSLADTQEARIPSLEPAKLGRDSDDHDDNLAELKRSAERLRSALDTDTGRKTSQDVSVGRAFDLEEGVSIEKEHAQPSIIAAVVGGLTAAAPAIASVGDNHNNDTETSRSTHDSRPQESNKLEVMDNEASSVRSEGLSPQEKVLASENPTTRVPESGPKEVVMDDFFTVKKSKKDKKKNRKSAQSSDDSSPPAETDVQSSFASGPAADINDKSQTDQASEDFLASGKAQASAHEAIAPESAESVNTSSKKSKKAAKKKKRTFFAWEDEESAAPEAQSNETASAAESFTPGARDEPLADDDVHSKNREKAADYYDDAKSMDESAIAADAHQEGDLADSSIHNKLAPVENQATLTTPQQQPVSRPGAPASGSLDNVESLIPAKKNKDKKTKRNSSTGIPSPLSLDLVERPMATHNADAGVMNVDIYVADSYKDVAKDSAVPVSEPADNPPGSEQSLKNNAEKLSSQTWQSRGASSPSIAVKTVLADTLMNEPEQTYEDVSDTEAASQEYNSSHAELGSAAAEATQAETNRSAKKSRKDKKNRGPSSVNETDSSTSVATDETSEERLQSTESDEPKKSRMSAGWGIIAGAIAGAFTSDSAKDSKIEADRKAESARNAKKKKRNSVTWAAEPIIHQLPAGNWSVESFTPEMSYKQFDGDADEHRRLDEEQDKLRHKHDIDVEEGSAAKQGEDEGSRTGSDLKTDDSHVQRASVSWADQKDGSSTYDNDDDDIALDSGGHRNVSIAEALALASAVQESLLHDEPAIEVDPEDEWSVPSSSKKNKKNKRKSISREDAKSVSIETVNVPSAEDAATAEHDEEWSTPSSSRKNKKKGKKKFISWDEMPEESTTGAAKTSQPDAETTLPELTSQTKLSDSVDLYDEDSLANEAPEESAHTTYGEGRIESNKDAINNDTPIASDESSVKITSKESDIVATDSKGDASHLKSYQSPPAQKAIPETMSGEAADYFNTSKSFDEPAVAEEVQPDLNISKSSVHSSRKPVAHGDTLHVVDTIDQPVGGPQQNNQATEQVLQDNGLLPIDGTLEGEEQESPVPTSSRGKKKGERSTIDWVAPDEASIEPDTLRNAEIEDVQAEATEIEHDSWTTAKASKKDKKKKKASLSSSANVTVPSSEPPSTAKQAKSHTTSTESNSAPKIVASDDWISPKLSKKEKKNAKKLAKKNAMPWEESDDAAVEHLQKLSAEQIGAPEHERISVEDLRAPSSSKQSKTKNKRFVIDNDEPDIASDEPTEIPQSIELPGAFPETPSDMPHDEAFPALNSTSSAQQDKTKLEQQQSSSEHDSQPVEASVGGSNEEHMQVNNSAQPSTEPTPMDTFETAQSEFADREYFPSAVALHSPVKHSDHEQVERDGYFPSAARLLPVAAIGAMLGSTTKSASGSDDSGLAGTVIDDQASTEVSRSWADEVEDEIPIVTQPSAVSYTQAGDLDSHLHRPDAPDGLEAGYNQEQLELARQMKEEFRAASTKKLKKGKKKGRNADEEPWSTPMTGLDSSEHLEPSISPRPTNSMSPAPDGFQAGYNPEQLELARQMKDEFASGSSKKSKKSKKNRSSSETPQERDESATSYFDDAVLKPEEASTDIKGLRGRPRSENLDGFNAGYNADQLELARQMREEFAAKASKKDKKKGKKDRSSSRTAQYNEDYEGLYPDQLLPESYQIEVTASGSETAITPIVDADGFKTGYDAKQLELARQMREEFTAASLRKDKKKDRKRASLLRSGTDENFTISDSQDPSQLPSEIDESLGSAAVEPEYSTVLRKKSKKDKKSTKNKSLSSSLTEDDFEKAVPSLPPPPIPVEDFDTLAIPANKSAKGQKSKKIEDDEHASVNDPSHEDVPQASEIPLTESTNSHFPATVDSVDDFGFTLKKSKKDKKNRKSKDVTDVTDVTSPDPIIQAEDKPRSEDHDSISGAQLEGSKHETSREDISGIHGMDSTRSQQPTNELQSSYGEDPAKLDFSMPTSKKSKKDKKKGKVSALADFLDGGSSSPVVAEELNQHSVHKRAEEDHAPLTVDDSAREISLKEFNEGSTSANTAAAIASSLAAAAHPASQSDSSHDLGTTRPEAKRLPSDDVPVLTKKSKKDKRRKIVDRRVSDRDEVFDDPALWEGAETAPFQGRNDRPESSISEEEAVRSSPDPFVAATTRALSLFPDKQHEHSGKTAVLGPARTSPIQESTRTMVDPFESATQQALELFENKKESQVDKAADDEQRYREYAARELQEGLHERAAHVSETKDTFVPAALAPEDDSTYAPAKKNKKSKRTRVLEWDTPHTPLEEDGPSKVLGGSIFPRGPDTDAPELPTTPSRAFTIGTRSPEHRYSTSTSLPIVPEESSPPLNDKKKHGHRGHEFYFPKQESDTDNKRSQRGQELYKPLESPTHDKHEHYQLELHKSLEAPDRDSGFIADSPVVGQHALARDKDTLRDSGYRDWSPASADRQRHSTEVINDTPALRSWPNVDGNQDVDLDARRTRAATTTKYPANAAIPLVAAASGAGLAVAKTRSRMNFEQSESATSSPAFRLNTPDAAHQRPSSVNSIKSTRSETPPLRRSDRKLSGDLRSLSQRSTSDLTKDAKLGERGSPTTSSILHDSNPIANEGRVRAKDMADVYVCRFHYIFHDIVLTSSSGWPRRRAHWVANVSNATSKCTTTSEHAGNRPSSTSRADDSRKSNIDGSKSPSRTTTFWLSDRCKSIGRQRGRA